MRKIILSLAMSLDGYIASEDGGYDWIVGDFNTKLDTLNKWDYNKFLEGIDTVVMGKKCYDQKFHEDFKDKKVYVATTKNLKDYDNIHFINGDISKIIEEEKQKEGLDIFIFGGGGILKNFLQNDSIDEYIIGIIPTILGKGRPLFLENNPTINLNLEEYIVDKGVVILKYSKREG